MELDSVMSQAEAEAAVTMDAVMSRAEAEAEAAVTMDAVMSRAQAEAGRSGGACIL